MQTAIIICSTLVVLSFIPILCYSWSGYLVNSTWTAAYWYIVLNVSLPALWAPSELMNICGVTVVHIPSSA